jgi:hypothetical protein
LSLHFENKGSLRTKCRLFPRKSFISPISPHTSLTACPTLSRAIGLLLGASASVVSFSSDLRFQEFDLRTYLCGFYPVKSTKSARKSTLSDQNPPKNILGKTSSLNDSGNIGGSFHQSTFSRRKSLQ